VVIGGGTQKVLRLAGELADIVGLHVSTATASPGERAVDSSEDRLRQKVEWVRAGAGERFPELELQMTVFALLMSDDPGQAVRDDAGRRGLTPDQVNGSVMSLIGTVDSVCEELHRRRELWGVSYVTVDASMAEVFAPVVARLAGT
jgi:hypothetical protein